jgi:hypothetical protein
VVLGLLKLLVLALCLHIKHLPSVEILKPPLGRGFSNLVRTTMSLIFQGCLKAAMGGSLKTSLVLLSV